VRSYSARGAAAGEARARLDGNCIRHGEQCLGEKPAAGPGVLRVAWRGGEAQMTCTRLVQAAGGIMVFLAGFKISLRPGLSFFSFSFYFCSVYKLCFQFSSINFVLQLFLPKIFSNFFLQF